MAQPAPVFDDLETLRTAIADAGATRVVLANGCFDPLHVGHVRYLAEAVAHGDFLVVAVNNDRSTRRLKGEGRPVVNERDRASIVAALRMVSAVYLFGDDDIAPVLEELRPDVHARETDETVDTAPGRETTRRPGLKTVIIGDSASHASRENLRGIRSRRGE